MNTRHSGDPLPPKHPIILSNKQPYRFWYIHICYLSDYVMKSKAWVN